MSDQQDTKEQAETSQDKLANNNSLLQSIMLNSFALGSFALICTIIIALTTLIPLIILAEKNLRN